MPAARRNPRYYPEVERILGYEVRSLLALPLESGERRIGVLEVENKVQILEKRGQQCMNTPLQPRRSRSYLLRVWQEVPDSPWRAMLRCVTSKEEHLFSDLDALVAFLKTGRGQAGRTPTRRRSP
ncbi:MAG: GAF domain-containing protein [Anaerolineae bacterium]